MIVTDEYRSPRSKPTSSATSSALNPRRTSPGINQDLRSDKPPIKAENLSQSHFKIQFVNTSRFGHKNQPVNFILIEDIPLCFNSKRKTKSIKINVSTKQCINISILLWQHVATIKYYYLCYKILIVIHCCVLMVILKHSVLQPVNVVQLNNRCLF